MIKVILVVEKTAVASSQSQQLWKACTENLLNLADKNRNIQLLGENVLLISLDKTLDDLSKVISGLPGLGYKYLILNEDVEWIVVKGKV